MKFTFTLLIILCCLKSQSQTDSIYQQAFITLRNMLENKEPQSFKKAVFITENAYYNNELQEKKFNLSIKKKVNLAQAWMKSNQLINYSYSDSLEFKKNGALFTIMTDTIFFVKDIPISYPYRYDFNDFFGQQEWANMFVSKLLITNKGNCHSMPYLYKILADELGTKAYLSFAPNHLYIKQRSKKHGWYNTELTSAAFPIDSWVMTTGYISRESIISGIYMDTLSNSQSIALCLIDLAHGYKRKKKENSDRFILQCCNEALKHFPNYVNALLLKSNILNNKYQNASSKEHKQVLFRQLNEVILQLVTLGYREIPRTVYLEWLGELEKNKDKYQNKKLLH